MMAELCAYSPPAPQLPADAHDTEAIPAFPPWLRAAVPGTSMALPQVPLTWLTTNAWMRAEVCAYSPPAPQLPADAHDTVVISANPPWLRAAVPGTSMALPQVPLTWLTTNACARPKLSL